MLEHLSLPLTIPRHITWQTQGDFVIHYQMDPAPEPTRRDQLFESISVILNIVKSLGPNDVIDVVFIEDGILALHDTLLRSRCIPTSVLNPFYLVCLHVCHDFTNQITSNTDVSDLKHVSVNGYKLCQLPRVLLALFHALSAFLNFICWYENNHLQKEITLNMQSVHRQNSTTTPKNDA